MKEKTIKIYRFDELSNEAQMKVVENHGVDFVDYEWYQDVFEIFKENMKKEYNFEVDNISFTGFGSQGDGASFTGEFADPIEVVDKMLKPYLTNAERVCLSNLVDYIGITRDTSRYVHKYTVSCSFTIKDIETDKEEIWDTLLEKRHVYDTLDRKINAWKDKACDELYKALENMYDYLVSFEHISDYYTMMDTTEQFLEDGSDS